MSSFWARVENILRTDHLGQTVHITTLLASALWPDFGGFFVEHFCERRDHYNFPGTMQAGFLGGTA